MCIICSCFILTSVCIFLKKKVSVTIHPTINYPSYYQSPILLSVTHPTISHPSYYQSPILLSVTHPTISHPSYYQSPILLSVTHPTISHPSYYQPHILPPPAFSHHESIHPTIKHFIPIEHDTMSALCTYPAPTSPRLSRV